MAAARKTPSRAPARPPDLREPLARLLRYSEATGVAFEVVPRHPGWDALGLPDLRGFAPQRRVVRRFAGEPAEFPQRGAVAAGRIGCDELTLAETWLLHDLAHVIWYDVATLTFGAERWREEDFFVEQHLASEAFAVLLLDYHLLSRSAHHGLAVDLDGVAWDAARGRVKALPPLDSLAMAHALVAHYFGLEVPLFRAPLDRAPFAVSGADAELLTRWRDHEASYADKQRWYVHLWWDDLNGRPLRQRSVEIDDPTLAELLWLTARRFTADPEPAFAAHVASAARQLRGTTDRFAALPKMRSAPTTRPDFRFTDAAAFAPATLRAWLDAAVEPSAEALFLLWQLLGRTRPDAWSPADRRSVATLAASVQTPTPDRAAWTAVRALCRRIVDDPADAALPPRPEWRAAFFLP